MEKNAKIYVAGHRGMVGSAIVRELKRQGYENIIVRTHKELDLCRQAEVEKFFAEEKPEYVFLAAAKVGGIGASSTFPADFMYENTMIAMNVIHSAWKNNCQKILFIGSACSYPKFSLQPIKEDYLFTDKFEPTNESYSLAKILGMRYCEYLNKQYGTNFISMMPTNLYGTNDNYHPEHSHVLPALIRRFHDAKIQNKPEVVCWGDGSPKREFLFVDDLADACVFFMNNYDENETVNIGTGKDISIKDLTELIAKVVGYTGKISWDTSKPNGAPRRLLDVSKAAALGWKYKIELEDGIKLAYEDFLKHGTDSKKSYEEITRCRLCGSKNLSEVFDLGEQYLTGVFPKNKNEQPDKGPLNLVFCNDCGLLQLKQSYSLSDMYGNNYGYRSGLNTSMVKHLQNKIRGLEKFVNLNENDLVLDIGSNDATSLKSYTVSCKKIGIDPTSEKFKKYYTNDIIRVPEFFSEKVFHEHCGDLKAKIVTSVAMFYDLENPVEFAKDVESVLSDDGIWHFEQSYMPTMLRNLSYDTVCHEHLEFYSLNVIKNILEKVGMKLVNVELNDINGGSFAVTACKSGAAYEFNEKIIESLLNEEKNLGLDSIEPYLDFADKSQIHREKLKKLLNDLNEQNFKIFGYGASTKGNVLLQYCGIGVKQIPYIVEVNEDKFGSFTPGTNIPIISEEEGKKLKPDYYFVLPWHFKENILKRERKFLEDGGKFIFPLPEIEIAGIEDVQDT